MNNAEIRFWGTQEAITDFLDMTMRPGEEPDGYDSRHSYEFAVGIAKGIGEAGETVLAELMKMKEASEAEFKPEATAHELAVAEINKLVAV
jgi:hypothetical protein